MAPVFPPLDVSTSKRTTFPVKLPANQVELLEGIDWSPAAKVIVAPRPDSPAPVALTALTTRLLVDEVNVEVITAFQREFGNRSPEAGASCPMQVDETR